MPSRSFVRRFLRGLARASGAAVALALAAASAQGQTGQINGTVTAADNGQPLPGVQVTLAGTVFGAQTGDDGRYQIRLVPPGTYTVETRRIGYAPARSENVRVAEQPVTVDFALRTNALALEQVVVTGVVDPTSGVKAPFTVASVSKEDMPVPPPSGSPVAALQGKVSGVNIVRTEGKPGGDVSVQLRSPASVNKSTEPLYVVDGVILGDRPVDIEALDIESIEVIKGAAASSLYGSRAQNGVIQIRTTRGSALGLDRTRITVRSEIGTNRMPPLGRLNLSHARAMNAQGQFLDDDGNVVATRAQAGADVVPVMDNTYPGRLYDQVDEFFRPGVYNTNTFSLANNSAATNFYASVATNRETGTVELQDGFKRYSGRLNLDHRLTEKLNLAFSGFHSRSFADEYTARGGLSANPFFDIRFIAPDVNLREPNPDGEPYNIQPDPESLQENPLYNFWKVDINTERTRTLGSLESRWTPLSFLNIDAAMSYDRSSDDYTWFEPKNKKEIGQVSTGVYEKQATLITALNGSLSGTVLQSFGRLTTRTTARGLFERTQAELIGSHTEQLFVEEVPDLDAGASGLAFGWTTDVRSTGGLVHTGLDYAGKYIGDALVRRDGSSLFGPGERWHTYYRASAAWRMAQESWWPWKALNEFKPRVSQGTAGGRPSFEDQYETWEVDAGGISKRTLGNPDLKPELSRETEFGLDVIALNRYSLQLTHARNRTTDQLLRLPLPAVTGYQYKWLNAGTVEGRTYEATLEAQLYSRGTTRWTMGLVADRSRNKVTEFNRSCERIAHDTITQAQVFYRCQGATLGTMYGSALIRNRSQLPTSLQPYADQFEVNDDGLLVWVGTGRSYRDAFADTLYGETFAVDGTPIRYGQNGQITFGHPIKLQNAAGQDSLVRIGDSNPRFSWGLSNSVQWKGLSVYGLVSAQVGGNVYNHTKQFAYRNDLHNDQDQAGKPDETKKDINYYQKLYNVDATLDWFVEDASFVKLRELSLRYALNASQLGGLDRFGFDQITFGLIGRNLITWSNYSGYDPEVGTTTFRIDDFGYPNFKTYTFNVEFNF